MVISKLTRPQRLPSARRQWAAPTAPDSGASTVDSTTSSDGAISVEALSVTLRAGSQATISVDVAVRELPAIYDVFMLQDLSGSFWDDLPNVQAQFGGLYDALNADGDVQFGVGSFIDKPVGVFGSDSVWVGYDESGKPIYTSDYVYQTHLGVSGDKAAIQESLDGLRTQYGNDWKEVARTKVIEFGWTAPFRVEDWDDSKRVAGGGQ